MSVTFTIRDPTIDRVIESEAPLFDPLPFFPTLTQDMPDVKHHARPALSGKMRRG